VTDARQEIRRSVPALVASIPITIVFFAVLGIVLTAAGPNGIRLSADQTATWIFVLYGFPTVLALVMTVRFRQPLLITGNIFAIIFFASLGHRIGFPELIGATMVAGAIVLVLAIVGVTNRIGAWIPAPIVQGVIAGAVMPFVVRVFTSLSTVESGTSVPYGVPLMVGAALLAFLASPRLLGPKVPPILPAFVVGILVAAVSGQLGAVPTSWELPHPEVVRPIFSWTTIVTVTPVLVALLTVQSTIPSVIYVKEQGYDPPEGLLNVVSGAGTILASFLGPVAVSLALPPVLLTAGPAAGPPEVRYRSVFLPVVAGLGIALFASTAADLATLVPATLLLTVAGLALVGPLGAALKEIVRGPLVLGPLFAFAIALSDMTLGGLGPFFWSLTLGAAISFVFERDGWKRLRSAGSPGPVEESSDGRS
jgi:benzoate membrane transport protein